MEGAGAGVAADEVPAVVADRAVVDISVLGGRGGVFVRGLCGGRGNGRVIVLGTFPFTFRGGRGLEPRFRRDTYVD